jgi:polar amino acid transport system permease protein
MTNTLVAVFKGTAIVSILAVNDLMRVATSISNATFKPVELVSAAAIVYCLIGAALSWLSVRVERRFPKGSQP